VLDVFLRMPVEYAPYTYKTTDYKYQIKPKIIEENTMKRSVIGLFLILFPLFCNAKVLEFYNDFNIPMSFDFYNSSCLNIVPDKFQLSPGQSKKVDLNILSCPEANYVQFSFIGWPSNNPKGKYGFNYQGKFVSSQLPSPFICAPMPDLLCFKG
jgi:hypothetical protein